MNTELIKLTEYCLQQQAELSFVKLLEESGLISLTLSDEEYFIDYDQLPDLECFVRWHYDLEINIEGIEALFHLVQKVKEMKQYTAELEMRLRRYE